MKVQEVILRAVGGELTWLQAADILGISPRTMRRWRGRLEQGGLGNLLDRRHRPSARRIPVKEVRRILQLYRTRYQGFNARHFHSILKREHQVKLSYSFIRFALQDAGLVKKKRARGRHRIRRDPRAMFGEMLHIDGSPHPWLALCPDRRDCLISIVDDATRQLLSSQLVEVECTDAILSALHGVFVRHGLPQAVYSDRASWAAHTPVKNEPVDKTKLTQVGRALKRLGIEHILAYSPQARGRGERANRTLQDRLVNELRVAGIRNREAANRYITEHFVPAYNLEFGKSAADPASAFVTCRTVDLDQILCFEEERVVLKDNTVGCEGIRLQIPKQRGRATCAGLTVHVRRHLDRSYSVWRGTQCWARHDARGRLKTPERARQETVFATAQAAV